MSAQLAEQAKALPLAEKASLAMALWEDLIESGHEPVLTAKQRAELDRRVRVYHKNPKNVVAWENIKADLDCKYGAP